MVSDDVSRSAGARVQTKAKIEAVGGHRGVQGARGAEGWVCRVRGQWKGGCAGCPMWCRLVHVCTKGAAHSSGVQVACKDAKCSASRPVSLVRAGPRGALYGAVKQRSEPTQSGLNSQLQTSCTPPAYQLCTSCTPAARQMYTSYTTNARQLHTNRNTLVG